MHPQVGCFGLRDCMTVFATFNLAPMLADRGVLDPTTAALLCPIAMQWISAPIHLLGTYDACDFPLLRTGVAL